MNRHKPVGCTRVEIFLNKKKYICICIPSLLIPYILVYECETLLRTRNGRYVVNCGYSFYWMKKCVFIRAPSQTSVFEGANVTPYNRMDLRQLFGAVASVYYRHGTDVFFKIYLCVFFFTLLIFYGTQISAVFVVRKRALDVRIFYTGFFFLWMNTRAGRPRRSGAVDVFIMRALRACRLRPYGHHEKLVVYEIHYNNM